MKNKGLPNEAVIRMIDLQIDQAGEKFDDDQTAAQLNRLVDGRCVIIWDQPPRWLWLENWPEKLKI